MTKKIDTDTIQQMLRDGKKVPEIMAVTSCGKSTIYRYQKKLSKKIESEKEENSDTEDTEVKSKSGESESTGSESGESIKSGSTL